MIEIKNLQKSQKVLIRNFIGDGVRKFPYELRII